MVQFIPQAQGASSFPNQPGPSVADILSTMSTGADVGSKLQQMTQQFRMRQPASKFLGIQDPPPMAPGTEGPPPPPNPLGPLANTPMENISSTPGPVIGHILGSGGTTVYYDPVSRTASLTPTPGAIPISGFKGPQALSGMNSTNMDQWRTQHAADRQKYDERLMTLRQNTALTPEQKIKLALVQAHSRILGNPLVDLQPEESQAMKANLDSELAELEKASGTTAPAPAAQPASPVRPTGKINHTMGSKKDPVSWLKKNYPKHPLTPGNVKWAESVMTDAK